MAVFNIKVFSKTGLPLGMINWTGGNISVSPESHPLFLDAMKLVIDRGASLPIIEEGRVVHLSVEKGLFSTMRNIKVFLEKSLGFKPLIVNADWTANQTKLAFITEEVSTYTIILSEQFDLCHTEFSVKDFSIDYINLDEAEYNQTKISNENTRSTEPDKYLLAA
jgi:hypothetical protein